jgi:heptosyltransferase-1
MKAHRPHARRAGAPSLQRTLFLQYNKIGDSLVMTPLFEGVKRQDPHNRVFVIGSPHAAVVFRNNPFIDDMVVSSLNPQTSRVDLLRYAALCRRQMHRWQITTVVCDAVNSGPWPAVLLQLLPPSTKVISKRVKHHDLLCRGLFQVNSHVDVDGALQGSMLDYNLDVLCALGCETGGLRVRVFPSVEERARAHAFVAGLPLDRTRRTIAFAPYSSKPVTEWPLPIMRAFLDEAVTRYNVLILGGPAEGARWDRDFADLTPRVHPAFSYNLREISVVLDHADLLVALNTGVSHLFQAIGIPMLRIDGGHSPLQLWGYLADPRYHVVFHPVPCSPCRAGACPLAGHPCMSNISAERVLHQVQQILATPIERDPCASRVRDRVPEFSS